MLFSYKKYSHRWWYLLGSQWDSHKPPGFYLILNCVPKMNEAFMELERHAGKSIMTKLYFGME